MPCEARAASRQPPGRRRYTMYEINETHDLNLRSWVESANDPNTDFPIQNLPFSLVSSDDNACCVEGVVRIGDELVRLDACREDGLFEDVFEEPYLIKPKHS